MWPCKIQLKKIDMAVLSSIFTSLLYSGGGIRYYDVSLPGVEHTVNEHIEIQTFYSLLYILCCIYNVRH